MPDDLSSQPKPGEARCPGTSWNDLMDADTRPVPDFLRRENYQYMGSDPLQAARYTSPDFFRREQERMWPRVWQFAAREEDIPQPGDYALYENAGRSYLVTRQQDGSIRAFHNVCLHRGRKLRLESGSAAEFKCPFHGFAWNNDGSLKDIPCRWDFPHLREEKLALPEAQVGRWAGYVFLREAAEGPSLEEYLAPLPDFFKRWRHEECTTVIWVGKVVNANWKVVAEAFMEAWHTIETHPQLLPFTGDANTQYSTYGDHVNAALTPFAVMSPHVDPAGKQQQWIVDEFLKYNGRAGGTEMAVDVPDGMTARAAMAAANREKYQADSGYDHSHVTDAELLDAFVYNVFPNFAPWGGFMPNIVYRWRPWPDQDKTLMEVRILVRLPADAPRPPPVEMKLLGPDQPWTDAPELGVLGDVFQQDMENLPFVQDGLKCSKNGEVQLGNYQEIRVRHLHATLDKYLAD
ncbi:aromatic ring-hydroxylating oxygenase subunit alpha [Niveispirillum fermenti]|uniref:aromatic ring-hydroxylating oxygenase subunit alpha n=1 Tax=Niveispirillum fermenti TaxID=1233113 RepID=UPI003A8654E8